MKKMVYETFYEKVQQFLKDICIEEKGNIDKAAQIMSKVISQDGLIYTFGTGHSHMIAEEVFYRAGGLVPVYAIIEDGVTGNHDVTKSEFTERLHGYAKCIMDYHKPSSNDCMIIISESGRNAVPVEMAMECKKRNIPCIAITGVTYSKGQSSRHESGKRLYEVADIVIDNHTLFGDTCMTIEDMQQPVGPTSNIAANFIIHSLVIETIARCHQQNIEVPIFYSGNLDGAREKNDLMLEKYWGRIRTW
ncbi:MAG: SIS domain-containing protein [Coprobacillus sp.]